MTGFRRTGAAEAAVTLQVDGRPVRGAEGDTVATALLAAGQSRFSWNARTGASAAPYCLIGICFGCLCTIDGRPGMQACLVPVHDGMVIATRSLRAPGGAGR